MKIAFFAIAFVVNSTAQLLTGSTALKAALLGDGLDKMMFPHSDLPVASTKVRNKEKKERSHC